MRRRSRNILTAQIHAVKIIRALLLAGLGGQTVALLVIATKVSSLICLTSGGLLDCYEANRLTTSLIFSLILQNPGWGWTSIAAFSLGSVALASGTVKYIRYRLILLQSS